METQIWVYGSQGFMPFVQNEEEAQWAASFYGNGAIYMFVTITVESADV